METPARRYVLNVTMADETGKEWFSLFNDQAATILGHTAEQLYEMRITGDNRRYEEVFNNALFQTFLVKSRAKYEIVKDESRLKCSISNLSPIDYVKESLQILEAIRKYD
jgi:replication factor A1